MHIKVWLKIEQIARLRCASIADNQIKRMCSISTPCFNRIIRLQEYKDTEEGIYAGTLTKYDQIFGSNIEAMKQLYAAAVPASMRALVDGVLQKRDLKTRLESAREILDRDPKKTFVKDSRPNRGQGDELPNLPQGILDRLGQQGVTLATEVEKADLGPSGKPN